MKRKPISTAGRCLKKYKRLILWLWLPLLVLGYWYWAGQPVGPNGSAEQVFVVPQGQSTAVIGQRLKQAKLIRSLPVFRLLVKWKNLDGRLQSGEFRLSPALPPTEIIARLTRGSRDFWITFPEGLRAEEYAERLAEKGGVDVEAFILAAKSFEGRLFPDTYLVPETASAEDIVALLTRTFAVKSPTKDSRTIIIASLIEREAKHSEDRKLVSSVIHNRLAIGMALQLDATVQYVLGRAGQWWPQQLSRGDLMVDSTYNTYRYPGLPPAPIANPGLEALQAAMDPAETNYLYYISDRFGYNHYAATLASHQANIEQYLND